MGFPIQLAWDQIFIINLIMKIALRRQNQILKYQTRRNPPKSFKKRKDSFKHVGLFPGLKLPDKYLRNE